MWKKLKFKHNQLTLNGTLNGGQSFRWKKFMKNETEQWIGVFQNIVWCLIQHDDYLLYKVNCLSNKECTNTDKELERMLSEYFRLEIDTEEYFNKWSMIDENFRTKVDNKMGIRILSQEFTENLFSFICSQNNNIKRISNMIETLCRSYGTKICQIDDCDYYTFPTIANLSGSDVEENLRNHGFGYRANYISETAKKIYAYGEEKWIAELKIMNYLDARDRLTQLKGVGKKVADCVCLMSLNHLEAIPVDTHIFQVAKEKYLPHLCSKKTVTDKCYNEINEYFRNLYGPFAGWAQTILFCADLKNI